MNDKLAVKLFTFENLIKLFEKEDFLAFRYFVPFVLFNSALSLENLWNYERNDLLYLSLNIFSLYFEELSIKKKNWIKIEREMQLNYTSCQL